MGHFYHPVRWRSSAVLSFGTLKRGDITYTIMSKFENGFANAERRCGPRDFPPALSPASKVLLSFGIGMTNLSASMSDGTGLSRRAARPPRTGAGRGYRDEGCGSGCATCLSAVFGMSVLGENDKVALLGCST